MVLLGNGNEISWVRSCLGTNQFGYEPVWVRTSLSTKSPDFSLILPPVNPWFGFSFYLIFNHSKVFPTRIHLIIISSILMIAL